MIFRSFFKPRWKSKNPQVRRQALRDLDPSTAESQSVFCELFRDDPDPIIRQFASRHVNDLALLLDVSKNDSDATVREHALARLRRLLIGGQKDSLSIEVREVFLTSVTDSKLLEFVARRAAEAALRESLMMKLNRDGLFGDMALQDVDAELRDKALHHISQRKTLERVLKGARTKDKRIRLGAQRLLEELKSKEARPEALKQQAKQLCARLDSLLASLKSESDPIRLRAQRQDIDKEWAAIETTWHNESLGEWDCKVSERYARLCEEIDKLLVGYAEQAERKADEARVLEPIKQEKEKICADLANVLKQLEKESGVDAAQLQRIDEALQQADFRWREAGELSPVGASGLNSLYEELVSGLQRRSVEINLYLKAVASCERIVKKAEIQTDNASDISKCLRAAEKLWHDMARPQHLVLPETLLKAAQSALEKLRSAKKESEQVREKNMAAFRRNVSVLEDALAEGKFKQASKLTRQMHNNIKMISNQDIKQLRDTGEYARYQRAAAQLKNLRDWQGWAASPVREALCQEVEALADEVETCGLSPAYDFYAASKKVQKARQRWKMLGPSEGETDDMWERFNQACNRAYAHCQKFFDQEAEARERNLLEKEALCAELEDYFKNEIENSSDEVIDWKEMDRTIATALQRWKKIGPVRRQAHASVRDRFNNAIQQLKKILKSERDRNKQKKEELIENAERVASALAASDKSALALRDSAAAIKLIQASWKEVGYATEERKLWSRFRAICDEVFSERQAQFDFQEGEKKEHLSRKETLCDVLERLAELTGEELENAKTRVTEIKHEWRSVGEVPRESKDEIEGRFRNACLAYDEALKKHAQHRKLSQRQGLYVRHELCTRLEMRVDEYIDGNTCLNDVSEELMGVEQAWAALSHDGEEEIWGALARRYQNIVTLAAKLVSSAGLEDEDKLAIKHAQQENLRDKREWCLVLEILAGVESPGEYEQERMAMQVKMLALKHGHERYVEQDFQLTDSINEIEDKWYATGSASASETVQLERRFSAVRNKASQLPENRKAGRQPGERVTPEVSAG